jgi:uncharacterized OB-fold protein
MMATTKGSGEEQFRAFMKVGELRFQQCASCKTRRWPPSGVCHKCLSTAYSWQPAEAQAIVVSYVKVNPPIGSEAKSLLEVHAEFGGGVRVTGRLVDPDPIPAPLVGRHATWTLKPGAESSAKFVGAAGDYPTIASLEFELESEEP